MENQTIGIIKEKGGPDRNGMGKDSRGYYRTGVYNNKPEKHFYVYKQNKETKIFNVSTESKIKVFPKISYEDFYQRLGKDPIKIDKNIARNYIRQTIESKMEE